MYCCKHCGKEFESRYQLAGHSTHCVKNPNYERNLVNSNNLPAILSRQKKENFTCKWCGKSLYTTKSGFTFHKNRCKENPNRKIHPGNHGKTVGYTAWNKGLTAITSESVKRASEKMKHKRKLGELVGAFKDKHHTEDTKRKLRYKAKEYIEQLKGPVKCSYSKKGCKLMDQLNIKNNWNLQHAENGGEFFVDGYWVDGYDKNLNIVFEYDEPKHYKDPINNILFDKDIERQNNIIKILNCDFWRYNEYLDKLYKVELTPSVNG